MKCFGQSVTDTYCFKSNIEAHKSVWSLLLPRDTFLAKHVFSCWSITNERLSVYTFLVISSEINRKFSDVHCKRFINLKLWSYFHQKLRFFTEDGVKQNHTDRPPGEYCKSPLYWHARIARIFLRVQMNGYICKRAKITTPTSVLPDVAEFRQSGLF